MLFFFILKNCLKTIKPEILISSTIDKRIFMKKNAPVDKLLDKHKQLTHTEDIKVTSHVQREDNEWVINTIMLEGIDVAFKYKRKKQYKSLTGQRVNITYYPTVETVAGFDMEVMNIIRIKVC